MNKNFTRSACAMLLATTFLSAPAFAASDDDIGALKAQLEMMTKRLNALESEQKATAEKAAAAQKAAMSNGKAVSMAQSSGSTVPGEGEPVVGGSLPGSFRLPGTDTSVKFGGYAKLDAIEDVNGAYGAQFANFSAIPLDGSASAKENGQFNMHARQSRLNMETSTPTDLGKLKTFLEFDFFGSARGNANTTNGEGMQLRQAYGQVGHILAGQTWTNFMDLDAYPESLDYVGPAGQTFARQAQIRYTDSITDKLGYSIAVEAANSDFKSPIATDVSLSDTPDLTGKLQYKDTFGELSLRGVARKLNAADNSGNEDTAFGWGLGLSGKINVFEKDAIRFQGVYGDGVGHYLFDVATSGNGSTFVNDTLDPQKAWGGFLAYQHVWSPHWRSNLIAGYTGIDNDVAKTGTGVNKEVASGHINLLWSPTKNYMVGAEYMHGYRETEAGDEGSLDRIQASFQYLF